MNNELSEVGKLEIVFLSRNTMKKHLEKLNDIPNTKQYLYPLLLKYAGRTLTIQQVLWGVMSAIGMACDEENRKSLFPSFESNTNSRKAWIEGKTPRIVKAMMSPVNLEKDHQINSKFRKFYKAHCVQNSVLIAVYAEHEAPKAPVGPTKEKGYEKVA